MSNADNNMNRKSKKLFGLGAGAMALSLAFAQLPQSIDTQFCSCPDEVAFVNQLPMSHPINRCASAQVVAEVSWSSWFSGQSNTSQTHFLDLLELLSRQADAPQDKSAI